MTFRRPLLTVLAALVAAGGGACVGGDRARTEPPPSGLALGPGSLASGTYIIGIPGGLDTVTLAAGRSADAAGGHESILLPIMAWGDLSGDDRREAVAVIATRVPQRGVLHELVVLAESGGRPVQIAHQYLGDRVDVEGLSVANRSVSVQMQVHGPNDPPCCPTDRVTRRFSIQGREQRP